jgi:hypothetical protein
MAVGDTGADLLLRDYLPRPTLSAREHTVQGARWTAVDAHNHLGKWLSDDGGWAVRDVPRLLAAMDAANIGAIVNLDGRW